MMLNDKIVKNRVKCAFQYDIDMQYLNSIKLDCEKLYNYYTYIELEGYQQRYWEVYIETKYYLKERVITNRCECKELHELALYEWLKICMNLQNDSNYDFYFEKYSRDKEEEIKQILFENNGKGDLRDIFKDNEQILPEWQIRLRTIAFWFLRRYNWFEAGKIFKQCNKCKPDMIILGFPRLFGAILIGFLLIVTSDKIIEFAETTQFNVWWYICIIFIPTLYLFYECRKTMGNAAVEKCSQHAIQKLKNLCGRSLNMRLIRKMGIILAVLQTISFRIIPVLNFGLFYSWTLAVVLTRLGLLGSTEWCLQSILFYTLFAFLIGVFIQLIWEEKTVTEPL